MKAWRSHPHKTPSGWLVRSSPHGTFVLGKALEACSTEACGIWGRHPVDLLGKTLLDLSPERQPEGSDSRVSLRERLRAARAGLPQTFEWQFQRPKGASIDTLVSLERAPDKAGTVLLGRVRDVTDVSCAESALRESEARLRQIVDNTIALVYVKDLEGRNIFVNRQLLRVFGLRESDVLGRTDHEIFPQAVAERFRQNDLQVLEQNRPIEFEETAELPDGRHTYISVKFPLYGVDGKVCALCGISTDITDRKRTEQALRSAALGVSRATGRELFHELARYLATSLGVDLALIGVMPPGRSETIDTIAVWDRDKILGNFSYCLAGTPCHNVVGQQFRFYPSGVQDLFTADPYLQAVGAVGYAGIPLFDSRGGAMGLMAVIDRKPLADRGVAESMLQIFSVRAAAELERVRSEEARRASEASYRSIFEASEDAIFVHDVDTGAIADVNPKACRAYGYSYEELKHLDVGQLSSGVPPYTLEQAVQRIAKARAGQPQRFEWHSRNKDGSLHWDEVFLKRATIGGVDRILAFTREITERKQAEEALRASEEQYRAIFNASVDALILWSPERRIVDANPASSRMFGYAPEELPGIDPGRLVPPEGWDTDSVVETGEGGETFHMEAKASRKDATTFDVDFHGVQVLYRGRPHMLSIIRDISERRQAEEQRSRLEAQLRQAQKMEAIGHLTGGIAHDFNNILTGVMGYIVLAQERAERFGDAKLGRYLERAQQSGQRARDLIQQMLTFSRGQRGEPRPMALAPLVQESVKLLRSTLPSSVEIRTHMDPAASAALLDPVQVEQVLMNLCINARDAMGGAGRIGVRVSPASYRGTLCASCRQPIDGTFVEIAVRDTGPGIAPDIQERIFEPFFSTKEIGRGSGMGLSVVHGIVHEYGGHVVLDTSPGGGSEFRVLFKPLASTGEAQGSEPARETVVDTGPALRGRVLVVDDDDAAGEFMRDLLESWGLEAELIRSSTGAREVFGRDPHRFDLAVLDQTMPSMTGLELSREILTVRPGIPVILYTGYSERLSDEQIASAGIRALVRKPVGVQELLALLQDVLGVTAA